MPELLKKVIYRWFWYLSAVVALFLISLLVYPSIIHSDTLYITCIYVVVDAFALAVGYSMLRKLNLLAPWKVIAYLAVVVAGSLAINFFLSEVLYKSLLFFTLIVFALLAFLNFALSKVIFAISTRDACLIGMLVGLVHAFICIAGTSVRN
jgi:hypothetical protein